IPYRLDNRPAGASFWRPAIDYLERHPEQGFRVEVVPTAAHWESYWLPRAGFALARGWYRQIDMEDNSVLYSKHLNPVDDVRWLRSNAVAYVLLPATELDPVGGPQEARILRSGAPGLDAVFKSSNLTIYRLHSPTPLLAGPGVGRVDVFDHTTIAGT